MASTLFITTQVAPYLDGPAGVHGVRGQATEALAELGAMTGLRVEVVDDVADLRPSRLEEGGVLALFTIGETPFTSEQQQVIESCWRDGRLGLFGVHSSSDACHGWAEYGELLGGRFDGHPWTQSFTIAVADQNHPATSGLGDTWAWRDEVYLFDKLRPDARVLLRLADPEGELDMSAPEARTPECGFPLAWCHTDGAARTFYSALGHFPLAWETPTHLRYLLGGLRWVLGDGDIDGE
jgi:type 1 glutamine amidotransferase